MKTRLEEANNSIKEMAEYIAELLDEVERLRDRITDLEKAGDAMASDITVPFTGAMQAWRKLRGA